MSHNPHRHPLSHFPIIGTLGRVLYLAVVYIAIALIMNRNLDIQYRWVPYAILGLAISDAGHTVLDVVSTAFNTLWRTK